MLPNVTILPNRKGLNLQDVEVICTPIVGLERGAVEVEAKGVDNASSPDASPGRRVPRRPLVAQVVGQRFDHRSRVCNRFRAAIVQRPPKEIGRAHV